MAKLSKFVKLNSNVLMEWTFDNQYYISENYKVITNLNNNKIRSFLSTTNINNINNNLFKLDSVLNKYALIDSVKYNFLQEQDYSSAPAQYDIVRIYLPTNYNFTFEGYIGLYLKIYAHGYYNENIYELSNIFFDDTDNTNVSGFTNLAIPFLYDQKEWGKYYQFKIPSINYLSNQRSGGTANTGGFTLENTINYNLTNGEGLSQTGPIFINFQYLNSKETVLGNTYYYASNSFKTSFSKVPEYNTLGVSISESSEGDYFEIVGTYGESNENLDNFVEEIENKGRRIRIEYDVYLYEENIQTNMLTISVIKDFSKKLYYRPVLTFSNTTAAIKVVMRVIDLVDMSTITRNTTLGLDDNIQKYGKKLMNLKIEQLNKIKIYNAKPDEIVLGEEYFSGNVTTEIVKVNSPQLIEVGKVLVNSSKSTSNYKGMGLLNIVITPFDNIIQFKLAKITNENTENNQIEIYNLSEILSNSEIILTFRSDTQSIDKKIYKEANNDYEHGIINFKILENDINVLKSIFDKGYNNFYLSLESNKVRTLLYSGTFSFYEDISFVDDSSDYNIDNNNRSTNSTPTTSTSNIEQNSEWPKAGKTVIIYTKYKNTTS